MLNEPLLLAVNADSPSLKLTPPARNGFMLRVAVERANQVVDQRQFWIKALDRQEIIRDAVPSISSDAHPLAVHVRRERVSLQGFQPFGGAT